LEEYQAHIKSDHYRFNLKRKAAQLPPLTPEQWTTIQSDKEKEALNQEEKDNNGGKDHIKKKNVEKVERKKKRNQQKVIENKLKVKEDEGKSVNQLIDEYLVDKKPLDVKRSLFCNNVSADLESNLRFMNKKYGFLIPFVDHCTNIEGLILYLGEKVGVGHYSLYDNKQFGSVESCQQHMRDKNICKILWEDNEEEYAQFYDYESLRQRVLNMSTLELASNGYELIVNNQKILGHRDLAIFYKQGLRKDPELRLVTHAQRLDSIERQKLVNIDRKVQQRIYKQMIRTNLQNNNQFFYRPDNPI
jgi:pre-60S factor REI1